MHISVKLLAAPMLCLLAASCNQKGERIIDMPYYQASNASNLDVQQVDLNDSSTVLTCHVEFRPGWWIRIDSASTITANGKSYRLIGSEVLTPGEQFTMPDSGKINFKLLFEPIPFETEVIDFSESNGGWAIWGIDISGEEHQHDFLATLPESVRTALDAPLELTPVNKAEKTTINVHIPGYRPEMGNISFYVSGPGISKSINMPKPDADGNTSAEILLCGTSSLAAYFTDLRCAPTVQYVAPGETTDIYIDPHVTTTPAVRMRGKDVSSGPTSFSTGRYAPLAKYSDKLSDLTIGYINGDKFIKWDASADEYTDRVLAAREESLAKLDTLGLPDELKEYAKAVIDLSTLEAISNSRTALLNSFYFSTSSDVDPRTVKVNTAGPEQLKRVYDITGGENPLFMMLDGDAIYWENFDSDYARQRALFSDAMDSASRGELTEQTIAALQALPDGFFADAAIKTNNQALEEIRQTAAMIEALPEVADNELFDAIVAKHKGKVILVDLWNTWCAPCRNALKANEPLKSGELSSDDIVWIYIADTSSSKPQYVDMIPNIKGLHYMVSSDQIKAIRDRFNVDGIPYYILVDRNGNAVGHPDFRDHAKLVEGIKAAL